MDSKKEQIIQAALKRFAHYGFHKTTMSEVAGDLSITKANLYYYYPDKDALIRDVLVHLLDEISGKEMAVIAQYDNDLLTTIFQLLELRAEYMRTYYVLHISENLEWIKGKGIGTVLEGIHQKDIQIINELFSKAVDSGEIVLDDKDIAVVCFTQIIKGIGLSCSVADVISGIPTPSRVDEILENQKQAVRFIFANKIR
ncbi:TetR/AcrR family transcriptional regulator [Sphingobacterium wenxiniae]|uniref:Transcriptional regulator, TetR family n=1 Tax=Sphingobacterium wenxiniae TaxID=683125 RepID=A0A1I6P9A4_9SPHI|nr:TetR/AcrR family transcriptional regulator [Sphingobacterium wenxiniae]SFS36756.1 transcriptional regulator, TetR family [Sphingobacterium wenxiniae]